MQSYPVKALSVNPPVELNILEDLGILDRV